MCYGIIYSVIWCYMFCDMMLYILCDIVLYVPGYGIICSVICYCLSCGVLSFGNRYIVVLMLLYIIVFLITLTD